MKGRSVLKLRISLLLFFTVLVCSSSAQMMALHGMVSKSVVSTAGVPLQSININFEANGGWTAQSGWNTWSEHSSDEMVLTNQAGTATPFKLLDLGGEWDREVAGTYVEIPGWPQAVLERNVYTFNASTGKTLRFNNLDVTKKYILKFAAIQNYDSGPTDNLTDITVNGQTKRNGLIIANELNIAEFTVLNPVGGMINITIWPAPGATYALICAMKLEEYLP